MLGQPRAWLLPSMWELGRWVVRRLALEHSVCRGQRLLSPRDPYPMVMPLPAFPRQVRNAGSCVNFLHV